MILCFTLLIVAFCSYSSLRCVFRSAQVEFVVEVQMFQLYRDGLEDLLKEKAERRKKKKGEEDEDVKEKSVGLKITLAGKCAHPFLNM